MNHEEADGRITHRIFDKFWAPTLPPPKVICLSIYGHFVLRSSAKNEVPVKIYHYFYYNTAGCQFRVIAFGKTRHVEVAHPAKSHINEVFFCGGLSYTYYNANLLSRENLLRKSHTSGQVAHLRSVPKMMGYRTLNAPLVVSITLSTVPYLAPLLVDNILEDDHHSCAVLPSAMPSPLSTAITFKQPRHPLGQIHPPQVFS